MNQKDKVALLGVLWAIRDTILDGEGSYTFSKPSGSVLVDGNKVKVLEDALKDIPSMLEMGNESHPFHKLYVALLEYRLEDRSW